MKKKGFTLVELLAVIAILAILVIIALPNVIKMFNGAKKSSFLTEAQSVYKEATKKYMAETIGGKKVNALSSSGTDKLDMQGKELTYCLILDDKGKPSKLAVGDGRYYVVKDNLEGITSITKEDVHEGTININSCTSSSDFNITANGNPVGTSGNACIMEGSLEIGTEYITDDYVYKYKQRKTETGWENISEDGWGVYSVSNKNRVESDLCTTINGKPIVSMAYMFYSNNAQYIDVSSFDTSHVTDMNHMFNMSNAVDIIGLTNFNTSNVRDMTFMFEMSSVKELNLSSFDFSNIYLNNGFINSGINFMFDCAGVETLDLSSLDAVRFDDLNLKTLAQGATITTGYARTQEDAEALNAAISPKEPVFTVK